MKITCQACTAKYTIADDKVLGKIVKIRCKKCGATIVVNGNDPSATADPGSESARFDYASQGGGEAWTVNVADGDQRTLTDGEVVDAYHAGAVNDETFCWKDGMSDWLPLREIEQLYAQCTSTRVAPPNGEDDGGTTKIQDSSAGMFQSAAAAPRPAAGYQAAREPAGFAAPASNGFADAAPLAARRAGGRAPAADLFSTAAQAGSEEDVMTSAPAGMPQPHAVDDKLTDQRNENSVLFSLNALTSKGGPPSGGSMPAGTEASGLIDIRQLSHQIGIGDDKKKKSRIDDIMNLGGGGAFAPSLGAPVLAPPPIEEYAPPPDAGAGAVGASPGTAGGGKSKMVIYGAVGAGALVILGAIGVASMLMRSKDDTAEGKAASSASAAADLSAAAPSASVAAATDTTAPSASAAPSAAATDSAASTAPAPTTTATATATTRPTAVAAAATAAATTTPAAATTAAPAATPAAAAGADQPFNMGEAKAKLGAIAGSVQACKKGDASGTGRAVVTFAPSGGVQSVSVTGVGFEGTPTGACVAGRFRGARVPPFSGSAFSVSKSFSIN
jgi:predicted Zn finger-like uncharacterized protein